MPGDVDYADVHGPVKFNFKPQSFSSCVHPLASKSRQNAQSRNRLESSREIKLSHFSRPSSKLGPRQRKPRSRWANCRAALVLGRTL